jgi:hypothetical protein
VLIQRERPASKQTTLEVSLTIPSVTLRSKKLDEVIWLLHYQFFLLLSRRPFNILFFTSTLFAKTVNKNLDIWQPKIAMAKVSRATKMPPAMEA